MNKSDLANYDDQAWLLKQIQKFWRENDSNFSSIVEDTRMLVAICAVFMIVLGLAFIATSPSINPIYRLGGGLTIILGGTMIPTALLMKWEAGKLSKILAVKSKQFQTDPLFRAEATVKFLENELLPKLRTELEKIKGDSSGVGKNHLAKLKAKLRRIDDALDSNMYDGDAQKLLLEQTKAAIQVQLDNLPQEFLFELHKAETAIVITEQVMETLRESIPKQRTWEGLQHIIHEFNADGYQSQVAPNINMVLAEQIGKLREISYQAEHAAVAGLEIIDNTKQLKPGQTPLLKVIESDS